MTWSWHLTKALAMAGVSSLPQAPLAPSGLLEGCRSRGWSVKNFHVLSTSASNVMSMSSGRVIHSPSPTSTPNPSTMFSYIIERDEKGGGGAEDGPIEREGQAWGDQLIPRDKDSPYPGPALARRFPPQDC